MSYATLIQAFRDQELLDRLRAAIAKEAWANQSIGDTIVGQAVKQNGPDQVHVYLMWPLCINSEADYEYAVNTDHEHPGGPAVITDAAILNVVQTYWPQDAPS